MKYFRPKKGMFVLIIIGLLFSCGTEEPINNEDPRALTLEVNVADDGSGMVTIEASALNTISYALYIDSDDELLAESIAGNFEYTFLRTGIYQISVRAYGSSGRYIRESMQIEVVVGNEVAVDDGYISALSYEGYDLVWNDEFEGTSVKPENWIFEIGTGCPNCGWGNNELEYYRKENAKVGNGVLTIEAKKENYQGMDYTSSNTEELILGHFCPKDKEYGRHYGC